mmetsp:Transcript_28960/g.33678  ORF Transcript_28960/g.33678 Transcript_28960/m.33678 type:complete len:105 (+) Transcript_28960:231-545(+)
MKIAIALLLCITLSGAVFASSNEDVNAPHIKRSLSGSSSISSSIENEKEKNVIEDNVNVHVEENDTAFLVGSLRKTVKRKRRVHSQTKQLNKRRRWMRKQSKRS